MERWGVYTLSGAVQRDITMKSIPTSPPPDKVILIHHGALGDFLNLWPSALAVRRACPDASLFWAGGRDRLPWLEPLGFAPCPPDKMNALDRVHGACRWPEELDDFLALWFVLDRVPDVPASDACRFLMALPPRGAAGAAGSVQRRKARHVRDAYAQALAQCGIATPLDWPEVFKRLFAAGRLPGNRVLLFPGAGHPGKQWPLVQYFLLADMLQSRGMEPLFVVGPAELERGIIPEDRTWVAPEELKDLSDLILSAKAVVGADTGPMHLAGMLGVLGVSLFGPTDYALWSPPGMRQISLGLDCSPCTTTCADLVCPAPRCMRDIPAERVAMELEEVLAKSENRLSRPW